MDAKKLKLIIRGEKKPTFGTDPNEPWSIRAGLTEGETGMLHSYLKSRGINPDFVSKDTKISHAKSSEFHKWKRDHMFDDPINYVSTTAAEKIKKIRAQTEEVDIEEMKTLKHTPVELRQHALNKAKHMTKVLTHNGLHKEETDKTDTITVDIPLMIRLLEYAREDAKTDMDLHSVTERLIEIRGKGMLTMADYDFVVTGKHKVKEEVEQIDELAPSTLASYVLKTTSKDPNRAEPRKKAMSKLAKAMAKQPVDPKAPRYSTNIGEGFDDHEEIAKELIRRHGMNVTKDHVKAIENERDSRAALDHDAVLAKVRAMGAMTEAKKPTALEKFRKAAAEREKKHTEIEKQSKEKPDMKGAIDRLEKHLNKEDVFQDPLAATQTAFDMGTQADDREPVYSKKKEMSKSARMIKALYKKHGMVKEELYDHEKEDKSVATYGKKPKVEKQEVYGDDDTQAAMILKGGKTLTGQTRDTLEIDPVMRKPTKPDNKENR